MDIVYQDARELTKEETGLMHAVKIEVKAERDLYADLFDLFDWTAEAEIYGDEEAAKAHYINKLNSGEWTLCTVIVKASFGPFSGIDTLGGVLLTPEYSAEDCVRDNGMIGNALAFLQDDIRQTKQFLNDNNL